MAAVAVSGSEAPSAAEPLATGRVDPPRSPLPLIRLLAALGALVCVLALPLAPVLSPSTMVEWNASRGSTTAFFTPYRAAELHVDVPCAVVRSSLSKPAQTIVLATAPVGAPRNGLVLLAGAGQLSLLLEQRTYLLQLPASGACDLRVDSVTAATTVTAGNTELMRRSGDVVPEIFTFTTDVKDSGLRLTAQTRSWFESTPTWGKRALMVGYAVLLGIALLTVVPGHRPLRGQAPDRRATAPRSLRAAVLTRLRPRGLVDLAVVCAVAWWIVVGPLTDDDGFAQMAIRNEAFSGDTGNYYRWFNASETPFTLLHQLFQPLVAISLSPMFLRLPSALAGVATWFLISRGVLGVVLPGEAKRLRTRALTAVAFLAWWLPYNLGLRPEAFVALGTAAVLALLLHARRRVESGRPALSLLAAAAGLTGLTLAITPSGLIAVALLLVFAPTVLRAVGLPRGGGVLHAAGALCLLAACSAVFVFVVFADMTLTGVLRATEVHNHFGPNFGWYEDFRRYDFLLSAGPFGSATKRLPVLMALVLLPAVALLLARQLQSVQRLHGIVFPALATAAAFAVLVVSPSKWSHHFGALVGVGVPFLVGAIVLLARVARREAGDSAVLRCGVIVGVALATVAGLAFSGPNTWWLYSAWDMPWSAEPVRPAGLPLNSPFLWVLLGAAGITVLALLGRQTRPRADCIRTAVAASPVIVAAAALAASVLLLLGSFSAAATGSSGSYTPGRANLAALNGGQPRQGAAGGCGLQDRVQVLPLAPQGVLRPALGKERASGFGGDAGLPAVALPPDAEYARGSLAGGVVPTGELVSPWFGLRALEQGEELSLWLSGRAGSGNSLELEFAQRADAGARPLGVRTLSGTEPAGLPPFDDPVNGRPDEWRDFSRWRLATLAGSQVPESADLVRVHAIDGSSDRNGWLAVTGPAVRTVATLGNYLGAAGRVMLDWPIPFGFPCRDDFPVVRGGLAQTPRIVLAAPDSYPQANMSYAESLGGVFAGLRIVAYTVDVPTRLSQGSTDQWGRVQLVVFPGQVDAYTTTREVQRVAGFEGGTPYPFQ